MAAHDSPEGAPRPRRRSGRSRAGPPPPAPARTRAAARGSRGAGYNAAMSITLTDSAAERVRSYLDEQPGRIGLRFGVRRTGCSGWAYSVDLAQDRRPGDAEFEDRGVRILVDPDSLPLVDGTCIDFVRRGLNSQFLFRNPNVAAECGCGESFTTADPQGA